MQNLDLYYTAHYNWAWVIDAALLSLKLKTESENILSLNSCPRFKDLPSTIASAKKEKATYSLFRIDVTPTGSDTTRDVDLVCKVRTRSDIFGFLDPKDSLARVCQLLDSRACMPDTQLIPWDWLSESAENTDVEQDALLKKNIQDMLSTGPKLLKAPLGSGGFGLYFVYSLYDIEEIVRCHRNKAQENAGFMQDLRATFYGFKSTSVLAWSLQDVISGVRVVPPGINSGGDISGHGSSDSTSTALSTDVPSTIAPASLRRRCQVRAYIVMVNAQLYLYKVYEVRLPSWDVDLDALLGEEYALYSDSSDSANNSSDTTTVHTPQWSNALENDYCGCGHGRPYNEQRNKGCTERYVLSELTELTQSEACIQQCMVQMFTALKPVLVSRQQQGGGRSTSNASGDDSSGTSSSGGSGAKDLGHVFDWDEIVRTAARTSTVEHVEQQGSDVLSEVAIVGVDLVLQQHNTPSNTNTNNTNNTTFSARIVEINNNPAMPAAEGKHMSALYKQHLVDFVSSTMQLAMYSNNMRLHSAGIEAQLAALRFDKI